MGTAQLEAITIKAEDRMQDLNYSGERQRYTFETHVNVHQRAHNDIIRGGNPQLDGATKVRKFLRTLTAPELQVPVATVRANQAMRNDWDQTVNFLRNFISSSKVNQRVALIQTNHSDRPNSNRKNERKVSRVGQGKSKYKPNEWKKLVRAGLHTRVLELRAQRKKGQKVPKKAKNE